MSDIISHNQRYLPHEIFTGFYAVKLYRTGGWELVLCVAVIVFQKPLLCVGIKNLTVQRNLY